MLSLRVATPDVDEERRVENRPFRGPQLEQDGGRRLVFESLDGADEVSQEEGILADALHGQNERGLDGAAGLDLRGGVRLSRAAPPLPERRELQEAARVYAGGGSSHSTRGGGTSGHWSEAQSAEYVAKSLK